LQLGTSSQPPVTGLKASLPQLNFFAAEDLDEQMIYERQSRSSAKGRPGQASLHLGSLAANQGTPGDQD